MIKGIWPLLVIRKRGDRKKQDCIIEKKPLDFECKIGVITLLVNVHIGIVFFYTLHKNHY